MNRFAILLVGGILCWMAGSEVQAQVAYVTYYAAPPCAAPAPIVRTTYYAPAPVVGYQPVPIATTRYRPFLGGSVTRIRTGYAPVVVAPVPVVVGY